MNNLEKAAKEKYPLRDSAAAEFQQPAFIEGAEYVINKCYDKERKQELFNYLSSEFGYTVLDEQLNDIIHILTKD